MAQPRVSPDGEQVLVQIADATADGGKTHLWLVDVKEQHVASTDMVAQQRQARRVAGAVDAGRQQHPVCGASRRAHAVVSAADEWRRGARFRGEDRSAGGRVEGAGRDSACKEASGRSECSESRAGRGGRLALLHRAGWEAYRAYRAGSADAGREETARRQSGCGMGESRSACIAAVSARSGRWKNHSDRCAAGCAAGFVDPAERQDAGDHRGDERRRGSATGGRGMGGFGGGPCASVADQGGPRDDWRGGLVRRMQVTSTSSRKAKRTRLLGTRTCTR